MKLSPYAEKLLAKASSPSRPVIAVPGETPGVPAAVPLPPALAKLPTNLRVREVAEYLYLSPSAVINLKDAGELEFINIAPRESARPAWRITRDSLARFEQSRKTRQP